MRSSRIAARFKIKISSSRPSKSKEISTTWVPFAEDRANCAHRLGAQCRSCSHVSYEQKTMSRASKRRVNCKSRNAAIKRIRSARLAYIIRLAVVHGRPLRIRNSGLQELTDSDQLWKRQYHFLVAIA